MTRLLVGCTGVFAFLTLCTWVATLVTGGTMLETLPIGLAAYFVLDRGADIAINWGSEHEGK